MSAFLSPFRFERGVKGDVGAGRNPYAKAGVPEVWLIDPRPGVGELVRHRDPEGASYRTVDRFVIGEDARDLDVTAILAS